MDRALFRDVGSMSGFCGEKIADVTVLAVDHDLRRPFSAFLVPRHAKQAGKCVAVRRALIVLIFCIRRLAEILEAIIRSIAVDVVDLICRPCAGLVEPDEPMSHVKTTIDLDSDVSVGTQVSCNIACLESPTVHAPNEQPGLGGEFKKLAQTRESNMGGSHEALLKLIGKRSSSVSSAVSTSFILTAFAAQSAVCAVIVEYLRLGEANGV